MDNTPHLDEFRRRFSRMDEKEQEIAAELIDSDILRNVLIDRGELVDNLPLHVQKEIVDQLPDHLMFQRIMKEHFMYKDTIAEMRSAPRKTWNKYRDATIEMRIEE